MTQLTALEKELLIAFEELKTDYNEQHNVLQTQLMELAELINRKKSTAQYRGLELEPSSKQSLCQQCRHYKETTFINPELSPSTVGYERVTAECLAARTDPNISGYLIVKCSYFEPIEE